MCDRCSAGVTNKSPRLDTQLCLQNKWQRRTTRTRKGEQKQKFTKNWKYTKEMETPNSLYRGAPPAVVRSQKNWEQELLEAQVFKQGAKNQDNQTQDRIDRTKKGR